jgi:hypothetical protein
LRVTGKAAPEIENPVPLSEAELTVTAAVPVDESVIDCEVVEFTLTLPKLRLGALTLRVGAAAFNCSVNIGSMPLAEAVSIAVCEVDTAETVAEKLALVAPDATVTEAGTVTEEELLARFTVNPPLAADAFSATVQASVPAPVIEELVQEMAVNTGTPVPLRAMAAVPLVDELLFTVTVAVAAPATVGSNCTEIVAV